MSIARALLVLGLSTLLTMGTALAQAAPPQGSQTTHKCAQTPKGCHKNQPAPTPKPQNKCGQTPKGCHKNATKPPAGTPPQ
jgi:hypothetical protein